VALGNAKLMADLGIKTGDLEHRADELRSDGATALFLAVEGEPGGVIAIADPSSQRRRRPSITCGKTAYES
jgi:Cu+-exporting ATPase